MVSKLHVLFCVEQGVLESQAKLLISSIERFLGQVEYQLHAYSPRVNSLPCKKTIEYFFKNNVSWCSENLNTQYQNYPIANKVLACNHLENNVSDNSSILFVDTDTVFLNPIDSFLLNSTSKLFLRPVDNKGPGSESYNDPNEQFWSKIFALTDVELPIDKVTTTVRQSFIRNYFNAGFIWSHKLSGFFQQWNKDFQLIIKSEIRPFGYQSKDKNDFRCLDQVALAVTAARYIKELQVLPETYNYPIPFRPLMSNREDHPKFNDLVHIHYHKWFQHSDFINYITNSNDKESIQYKWLYDQLPLKPLIYDEFKC